MELHNNRPGNGPARRQRAADSLDLSATAHNLLAGQ